MNKIQEQVAEFHRVYSVPIRATPGIPSVERVDLRLKLIQEEFDELGAAFMNGSIEAVADALGDLLYVTFGTALECGLDMEPINDEIHKSNLSKLGADGKPVYAENGKVLKGPSIRTAEYREGARPLMPKLKRGAQITKANGVDIVKRNKRIVELSEAGLNLKQIATRMDMSISMIGIIVKEAKGRR